jgi:hypothetical protein
MHIADAACVQLDVYGKDRDQITVRFGKRIRQLYLSAVADKCLMRSHRKHLFTVRVC